MDKIAPFVSIIVVNFNRRQYLKECFDALLRLDYPAAKMEIIMVDNCSDDDSISFVQKNYPDVKILKNDINNYARANNLGIKIAKGEFVAFINNDIQVSADWLIELINVMNKEKRSGIAGGKILLEDGKIQSAGHEEYPDFYWGDRGYRYDDKGQYENVEEALSVCGAAVLYRKSCIDDIGFFDEDFVMYLEDVDMSFRCSRNKWKIMYVPKSIATHYFRGTSSAGSARYFSERNRLLVIAKHFPKQLGKALFGKGYFSYGENSIYDILPLIFKKLLESQKSDDLKTNLPAIFANLKKISILEKSILMDEIAVLKSDIAQKETHLAELNRAHAQLNEQIQKMVNDIGLKDMQLREKEASLAELGRAHAQLTEKEASLVTLSRANAQLNEQIQMTVKDIGLKDAQLGEKEARLIELNRANTQLNDQLRKMADDMGLKDAQLREKETHLIELNRANTQLNEQLRKMADDMGLKDTRLREKETSLVELGRANVQLNEQIQKMVNEIGLKDSLLREKDASLTEQVGTNARLNEQIQRAASDIDQKESQLRKINEELMVSKDDLEKILRFDQKMNILLVKPHRITIADTEETIRIIKRKYPHSSVYVFANLIRQEYERLMKNNNVEKSLIYCRDGAQRPGNIAKLYLKLFLTRFDIAVALLSRKSAENYAGYSNAARLAKLSNSKNHFVYYVD